MWKWFFTWKFRVKLTRCSLLRGAIRKWRLFDFVLYPLPPLVVLLFFMADPLPYWPYFAIFIVKFMKFSSSHRIMSTCGLTPSLPYKNDVFYGWRPSARLIFLPNLVSSMNLWELAGMLRCKILELIVHMCSHVNQQQQQMYYLLKDGKKCFYWMDLGTDGCKVYEYNTKTSWVFVAWVVVSCASFY